MAPAKRVTSDTPRGRAREFRAEIPELWPRDKTGREYFHRGLARLLWERGGTAEAADSIRCDLEDGRVPTVFIDDDDGEERPITPQLWLAAAASAEMYWTGRAIEPTAYRRRGHFVGDVYLVASAPAETVVVEEPAVEGVPDWWPGPGETLTSWAMRPEVNGEAGRRLKAAGVAIQETAMHRAMEAMAGEAHRHWKAASIGTTRRANR